MTMTELALIEDDRHLTALLAGYLNSRGYRVLVAHDGPTGMKLVYARRPSLVLLDLNLPGYNGWEVLERIRDMSDVPVIVLTAQGEETFELRGFAQGADDFVAKPFSFAALAARIAAVLSRAGGSGGGAPSLFAFGDLRVDLLAKRVWCNQKQVHLTPTEFKLLAALVRQAGKVITSETLIEETWGEAYLDDVGCIRRCISAIRRKLEAEDATFTYIHNERGVGYRFQAVRSSSAT